MGVGDVAGEWGLELYFGDLVCLYVDLVECVELVIGQIVDRLAG